MRRDLSIQAMSVALLAALALTGGASAQFFDGPESVTYDATHGRYLVSNALNGNLVQISDEGDTTFLDTSLSGTRGLTIVDDTLYVAANEGVVTYDLTTDLMTSTTPIPGMSFLNDVAADSSGYLYISDSSTGQIHRMRISDHSVETIITGYASANGILYDAENDRLLFCQYIVNAPIHEIDLIDFSVTTLLTTTFARFDGLALDGLGNIYVSAWGTRSVYRYDSAFSQPPEVISSDQGGPADIFYNPRHSILAVPCYIDDRVDLIPISLAGIAEDPHRTPRAVAWVQNDPNPISRHTTIRYDMAVETDVAMRIYDIHGRVVRTLVDRESAFGAMAVVWDGRDTWGRPVGSGIYTCRIQAEGVETIGSTRMVVVR